MAVKFLDFVLDAFKTHCNVPDLRIKATTVLFGEIYITILAPQPTSTMYEFARILESDFEELGYRIHIDVRRSTPGLWGWLACLPRRMLG